MTLRPEPVVALLVTGVLLCMIRFLDHETAAPIAVAGVLVAMVLAAHPAGVVSFAAVAVASPQLYRWVRRNAPAATTILAATIALLALLLFAGSDLEQRRSDAQLTRTYASSDAWRDELTRYTRLSQHHYGTPLRRGSVALMLLAVLAFTLRRRRTAPRLLNFPASVLTVGLVLLIATPSKWPSHFGTLIGVGAVAIAAEAARLREGPERSRAWDLWPFLAVSVTTIAVAWSWLVRESWNAVDLRTLDWNPGVELWLPVSRISSLLPPLVLALVLLVALRRGHRDMLPQISWRVVSWTAPLVVVPLIGFTAALLLADTARTSSWTLARQNLESVAGVSSCGLADDMLVPLEESARALPVVLAGDGRRTPGWVPPPPIENLPRFALGPTRVESASTPWFALPANRRFGVYVAGSPRTSDRILLEWGRVRADQVDLLAAAELDIVVGPLSGTAPWRFIASSNLAAAVPRATGVRVSLRPEIAPAAAIAFTAPVTYKVDALARRTDGAQARTLVFPNLLTYFPCADLPRVSRGAVEVPDHVVTWTNEISPLRYPATSPFAGVVDLYPLHLLPTSDSEYPPATVFAYEVERSIPGSERLAAVASTVTS
jgi:hypothetical protein